MNAAATGEDLQQVARNEYLANTLITAGWLKPLTVQNRNQAMQTLIVHDVLVKRKEPLDQFCKGLETLGILGLVRTQQDLMKKYFISNLEVALTSQEVIGCLDIRPEDNDREAKQFLLLAIQNLENGLCGIIK